MWGLGIALMALADRLFGRRRSERKHCDVCNRKFESFEQVEDHRRREHPDRAL